MSSSKPFTLSEALASWRKASPITYGIGKRVARFGFFVTALGVGSSVVAHVSLINRAKLADNFYIDFDLDSVEIKDSVDGGGALEKISTALVEKKKKLSVKSVTDALARAKQDERCKGLLLRSSGDYGHNEWLRGSLATMATMQEIRNALVDFSGSQDKLSYACFSTFGELGSSNGLQAYTLATAMRDIHIQPSGHLSIMGFGSRAPFFRGLLDKLKIEPFVIKRNSYKNALNNFTEEKYTSAHREATDHLLGTLFEQCVHDISTSRQLDPRQVKRQVDNAPLSAEAALEHGLITGISYMSNLQDMLREKVKHSAPLSKEIEKGNRTSKRMGATMASKSVEVKVERYIDALKAQETLNLIQKRMKSAMTPSFWSQKASSSSSSSSSERVVEGERDASVVGTTENRAGEQGVVALVYAKGAIMNGASEQQDSIQSSTFSKLLDKVHHMKKVKAVVLRVDTPGGSVVGSDEIYNQIRRLQAKKIKVVISMGNVAASGGYYISAPADAIFASPGTLTGSIGVIMGKFNFEGFLKDLGISIDEGRVFGRNANMMSPTTNYTWQQKRKLNQMIDDVYDEFLRKVSDGRSIPHKQVKKLANGRVWTGEDAYRLGLVDQLGGLASSISFAKELAGLPEDAQVKEVKNQASFLAQLKRGFALMMSAGVEEDPLVSAIVAKLKLMKIFQGQGMLMLEPELMQ